MLTRPPFPPVVDSTMLATFRSCPRKFELEFLRHYKSLTPSVHLVAGAAYARGLEVARKAYYEESLPDLVAQGRGLAALLAAYGDFQCQEDSAKSATRMAGALEFHFSQYPLPSDPAIPHCLPSGARAIEFSFVEPTDIPHPETGNPILYSGRFDMVVDFQGGLYGLDDKTTSALGATWPKQWDLRSQFTAYCWGASRAGFPLQGFLIRGISILKTKYETQQAITYRPAWTIERWYSQTQKDLRRMIQMWESGQFDYNLDHACTEYGGCSFRQPCLSPEPDRWLAVGFERRAWDPVERTETILPPESQC